MKFKVSMETAFVWKHWATLLLATENLSRGKTCLTSNVPRVETISFSPPGFPQLNFFLRTHDIMSFLCLETKYKPFPGMPPPYQPGLPPTVSSDSGPTWSFFLPFFPYLSHLSVQCFLQPDQLGLYPLHKACLEVCSEGTSFVLCMFWRHYLSLSADPKSTHMEVPWWHIPYHPWLIPNPQALPPQGS